MEEKTYFCSLMKKDEVCKLRLFSLKNRIEELTKIEFRRLTENDVSILAAQIELYAEVFEMEDFQMPASAYLQTLLEKDYLVFWAAVLDSEIIGGATCYVLPSVYAAASEIYLYDLAVKTEYQRQGIGTQLIAALKNYGVERGHQAVFVQADLEDQHAIDFYRKTGGQSADVVHFSYTLTSK
jgi:aminoglycoside 3-N-acetyltransferase I